MVRDKHNEFVRTNRDEMTHFTQSQFLYLLGRLRSQAKTHSFAMGTCNPDPDSWVLSWVEWYLNSEGYPDPEKDGIIRYFVIVEDRPIFANTEKELADAYPEICYAEDNEGDLQYVPPMSFCFISGTIFDNKALLKSNPKYLSALKAQSPINRARLLDGNWFARPEGSSYFQRQWLNKLDHVPLGCIEARGWDLASAEPSDKNRYPDYTASIKMLKTDQNNYIIVGDYIKDTFDELTRVNGKFRKRPGVRDKFMLSQAKHDGVDTTIVLPKDPGQAGTFAFQEMAKYFTNAGFLVAEDPNPSNKSKLKRFEAFSSAAQNGLVSIVEDTFEPATLAAFYKELESFDGERSTADRKDDWPDATASVFAYLAKGINIVAVPLPTINAPTMISGMSSLNYF